MENPKGKNGYASRRKANAARSLKYYHEHKEAWNKRSMQWQKNNRDSERKRHQKRRRELKDCYIRDVLKKRGVKRPTADDIVKCREDIILWRSKRATSPSSFPPASLSSGIEGSGNK